MLHYLQGEYMTPRVVNLILRYLGQAIIVSQTWKIIKPHVETLITKFVFPLMCFNDEDEELWQDDPQEYIRKVTSMPKYDITHFVQQIRIYRVLLHNGDQAYSLFCGTNLAKKKFAKCLELLKWPWCTFFWKLPFSLTRSLTSNVPVEPCLWFSILLQSSWKQEIITPAKDYDKVWSSAISACL